MFESDGKRHLGTQRGAVCPRNAAGPSICQRRLRAAASARGLSSAHPAVGPAHPTGFPGKRGLRASISASLPVPGALRPTSDPQPLETLPCPSSLSRSPHCTLHVLPDGFLKAAPSLSVSAGSLSRRDEARIWTRPATRPRAEHRALSLRPAVRLGTS